MLQQYSANVLLRMSVTAFVTNAPQLERINGMSFRLVIASAHPYP